MAMSTYAGRYNESTLGANTSTVTASHPAWEILLLKIKVKKHGCVRER